MDCSGAAALVTGGAKRVGRAIVLALADAGCDVAIHYRASRADAEDTVAEVGRRGRRAVAIAGDLSDARTPGRLVADVLERFGRLDVLVNNAAVFEADPVGEFDEAHWRRTMQVNVLAPAALVAAAADALGRSGFGKIVNLLDSGADRAWPSHRAYAASKAALANLTRSAARQLAPRVQVNGVAPGIAVFPDEYDEELRAKLISRVPLGRAGSPEDVARTVRFLVEQGDYITGQIINVDGGRSIV